MRRPDWQPRMAQAIREMVQQPFVLGSNDCALGTARVLDAMCDSDYAEQVLRALTPFYSGSERELTRFVAANGGLREIVTGFLGEPIPAGWAQAGDVALVRDYADQLVLGVHEGLQVVCAGVGPLPVARIVCAWAVGR